ncbi:MAG: hypothetical protein JRI36_08085, partial [Deltaproteobacteria bacterium]|nr:hypothetical protein [Deltaproteobacteria bacterium]
MKALLKEVLFPVLVLGCLLAGPVTCRVAGARDLIETVNAHARINWSRGVVVADESHPLANGPKQHNAKAGTPGPCPDLFEAVQRVRIDASSFVKDLVKKSDMIRAQLDGMLRNPQV